MSDQSAGSTGRWLKRITQSMSGEPLDLAELIEDLREASARGLFDGDGRRRIKRLRPGRQADSQYVRRHDAGAGGRR